MDKKEAQALALIILLAIVGFIIIVLQIRIAIIHLFQNMFWISLFFIPLFFLLSIIFFIWGLLTKEYQDNWGFYSEPEFFTKGVILFFSGILFVLFLISILSVPFCYERGYSDNALQKLAEYQNDLESMQQLQSILTGEIVWDIQNQVMEETINNLCKDPNYPCESVKQSYQVYKDIKGAKDDADEIANFFGIINKNNPTSEKG